MFIALLSANLALADTPPTQDTLQNPTPELFFPDTEFADIAIDNEYYDALAFLKVNGIIKGYDDGTFKPNNTINRAEFTKIIIESNYAPEEITNCLESAIQNETEIFPDVPAQENIWFSKYICLAKEKGIIKGYDDGTFKPTNTINFAESAKIMVETGLAPSTPSPQSQLWYADYISALEKQSAIPESIKSVANPITRGQMAEIIFRLLNQITDKESLKAPDIM